MIIELPCEHCGVLVEAGDEDVGAIGNCPHCGRDFFIVPARVLADGHRADGQADGACGSCARMPGKSKSAEALGRIAKAAVVVVALGAIAMVSANERVSVPAGVVALACGYFAPAYVGAHKRNFTAILMLNLLLGWTGVGWIGAMIWAALRDKPEAEAEKQKTAEGEHKIRREEN